MKNVNANEKFEKARDKNIRIYLHWIANGAREADDELNSSNREFINAYKEKYPEAMGYKMYSGFVELSENICNFGVDFIFRKNEDIMEELRNESDNLKIISIFEKYNAPAIVWS